MKEDNDLFVGYVLDTLKSAYSREY